MKHLQHNVAQWVAYCFGVSHLKDRTKRVSGFLEEALELFQAHDLPKEKALELVECVYSRPKGAIPQEIGGVLTTLAAVCAANNLDMESIGTEAVMDLWARSTEIAKKHRLKPHMQEKKC